MNRRVLIVDDETAIREMIVLALEMAGYETVEAADGLQALRLIQSQPFDLVLMDWMMPGPAGLRPLGGFAKTNRTKPSPS